MLTLGTHKIYKITSLTADSYKQLFALITMLLTVLSVQQSTFAMAAPLQQQSSSSQPTQLVLHHELPTQDNYVQPQSSHHYHHQTRYPHDHDQNHRLRQPHPEHQLHLLLAENDDNNQHHHRQLETGTTEAGERLHKRHISWQDYYFGTMNYTEDAWYNPCGGQYDDSQKKSKSKPPIKKVR